MHLYADVVSSKASGLQESLVSAGRTGSGGRGVPWGASLKVMVVRTPADKRMCESSENKVDLRMNTSSTYMKAPPEKYKIRGMALNQKERDVVLFVFRVPKLLWERKNPVKTGLYL